MNPVVLFSLVIFCVTVQLWLVLIALSAAIPQANILSTVILPEWQHAVLPERDALLLHSFVAIALMSQAIGIWWVRHRLNQVSFIKAIKPLLVTEAVWTALMLNATFKEIVYHNSPWLAKDAFIGLSVGALLSKIFWTELKSLAERFYEKLGTWKFDIKADLWVCLGLILLLYVPDSKAVLARMFFGEQFHHFDSSYLAPAWAYAHGAVLDVDIISEYGIGTPVLIAWVTKLMGGLTYIHMFWYFLWGSIFYFILCYVFLRRWLGSLGVSLMGILLIIKFQMFHFTMAPFIFTFPISTVMRYFWDIIFFFFLLEHLRSLRKRYLFLAAICCGVQVYYVTVFGYCLIIAFFAYLMAFMVLGHLRRLVCRKTTDFIWFFAPAAVVPLTTVFLLWLTQGSHLWSHEFWSNTQEFNNYFLSGFGLMPMYESIQNREALLGFMGFIIPIVYMGTFLVTAGLLYWDKLKRDCVLVPIFSLYGLSIYHYYMGRSGLDGYYTVIIPYVFILCFWLQQGLAFINKDTRRPVTLGLLALAVYALVSNHLYLSYPNLLNVSRNPIVDPTLVEPLADGRSYFNQSVSSITEDQKLPENSLGQKDEGIKYEKDFKTDDELKKYFDQEFDYSQDAALIDSLTQASDPVALLSSFETRMLMQADRRPFFYYSPILIARPMRMRTFPNSAMFSSGHALRTINQLQTAKPEYIFMEKIFLQAPGVKNFKDGSLAAVLNYIFANYTPEKQGEYLVAFKRKQ